MPIFAVNKQTLATLFVYAPTEAEAEQIAIDSGKFETHHEEYDTDLAFDDEYQGEDIICGN